LNIANDTYIDGDLNVLENIFATNYFGDASKLSGILVESVLPKDTTCDNNAACTTWGDARYVQQSTLPKDSALDSNAAAQAVLTKDTTCDNNAACTTWGDGRYVQQSVLPKDTTCDNNTACMTDLNKHFVPYIDGDFDVNLGVYNITANDLNAMYLGIETYAYILGKLNVAGDVNMSTLGVTNLVGTNVNLDLNILSETHIDNRVNIRGDLNITSPTKHLTGVSIESDLNRICFPSEECQAYIDWNGQAFIMQGA